MRNRKQKTHKNQNYQVEVVFVVLQPGRLQLDPNFSTQRILFIRGCGSYAAQQLVANSSKILDAVNVMNHAKLAYMCYNFYSGIL